MASSPRRRRRDAPSGVLSVLGNVLLLLMTLAVGSVAGYLIVNPPGVLDPASQQAALPVTTPDTTGALPSGAPVPPVLDPGEVAGMLSLGPACGAVAPLLTRSDDVRTTAIDNPDALDTETISDLTRDLQSLSVISPAELKALIDPLTTVLVELNNSVLAGEENPQINSEAAEGTTDSIRTLCDTV